MQRAAVIIIKDGVTFLYQFFGSNGLVFAQLRIY